MLKAYVHCPGSKFHLETLLLTLFLQVLNLALHTSAPGLHIKPSCTQTPSFLEGTPSHDIPQHLHASVTWQNRFWVFTGFGSFWGVQKPGKK